MSALGERVVAGDHRAAARLMRLVDDRAEGVEVPMAEIYRAGGKAHIIGLTGNPGVGKSTLCDALIKHLRAQGKTVGVIAVDPSSPYTGGALLGDRIRMQEHALDKGVFIRSLATRGAMGGLSRSASASVRVLDALGMDFVLLETVGVGQDEVDILGVAHTIAVILAPGLGDDVQSIKAGILEIADVLVVSKADRPGADHVQRDLRQMLDLRDRSIVEAHAEGGLDVEWETPVVKVSAAKSEGIDKLTEAFAAHRTHLDHSPAWQRRRALRAQQDLEEALADLLIAPVLEGLRKEGRLARVVEALASGHEDPYTAARTLIAASPASPST